MKDLRLYFTESCPYCAGPIDYIKEKGLDVELIDATYDRARQMEIIKAGGKIQVPMLYVDGKGIYESKDIMDWLKNNF